MDLEKDFEKLSVQNITRAQNLVIRNMNWTNAKIAKLFSEYDIKNPQSFRFGKNKLLDTKLMNILGTMSTNVEKTIVQGMVINWGLANQKNDILANQYLRNINAVTGQKKNYFAANTQAMNSFINRTEDGMNLSERVWNITDQYKSQLETYLGTGISIGRPASDIAMDLQNLLKNPDKLFRRVQGLTGSLILSAAAKAYRPGAGIYRSSYRNALRLAATETNMAYRMSDYTRRQQCDFVMGIRIHLSKSHPRPDICDSMAGDYPSNYVYRGWHPWCLCYSTSILMSGSEYKRMQATDKKPARMIKDIPGNAKKYMNENAEIFGRMKSKPFFITDNEKAFIAYTPEDKKLFQLAKESGPEVDMFGKDMAEKYGGVATDVNLKTVESATRKANSDYDGDFSRIKDLMRTTIIVDKDSINNVLSDMKADPKFFKVKRFTHTEHSMGYDGILATFQTENGSVAEVQVMTPKILYGKQNKASVIKILGEERYNAIAKEVGIEGGLGHIYYENWRVLDFEIQKELMLELEKKSKEYYALLQ